jgi:hypothetical protein
MIGTCPRVSPDHVGIMTLHAHNNPLEPKMRLFCLLKGASRLHAHEQSKKGGKKKAFDDKIESYIVVLPKKKKRQERQERESSARSCGASKGSFPFKKEGRRKKKRGVGGACGGMCKRV